MDVEELQLRGQHVGADFWPPFIHAEQPALPKNPYRERRHSAGQGDGACLNYLPRTA
jgi:hypothetical protein